MSESGFTPAPVTAVIPCYGGFATLGRALASIAAQTLPPAEVIVVDDGNPEPQRSQLAALSHPALALRVVRQEPNRGLGAARNFGWERAAQKYVAFLDDDDAWHPRKLALQTAAMERDPALMLCATGLFESRSDPAAWPAVEDVPRAHRYPLWPSLAVNPSHPPTWMVRRDLPRRFPETRHCEDFQFLLALLLDGLPALHLDAELACVFKPRLGRTTGLSSQLVKMERAELQVYASLRASGRLGLAATRGLQAISLLKFARRVALRVLAR